MRLMSTIYSGETSLNFIMGIRLWPPESNLASGPSFCSRAIASSRVRGEKYSKFRGIIGHHLSYIGIVFRFMSTGKDKIIRGGCGNVNIGPEPVVSYQLTLLYRSYRSNRSYKNRLQLTAIRLLSREVKDGI